MPDPSSSGDSISNAAVPILIKKRLRQRFYEAIVFLSALTTTWEVNRQPVSHDPSSPSNNNNNHNNNNFETRFKTFVNTLSAFCDIKQGGDSVTAFAVLDLQDRIQYRFACNKVNTNGLEKVKAFVTDLLTTLRENESGDVLEEFLFDKVLNHCRKRVCSYLKCFDVACHGCIQASTSTADTSLLEQLMRFQDAAPDAEINGEDTRIFARGCRRLTNLIDESHRLPEGSVLAERASHSSMNHSSSCWSELRHYAGRLNSYSVGVRRLMAAARTFPRLIEEGLELKSVQSSCADPNPMERGNLTAQKILGRMCPNPAQHIQRLGEARAVDVNGNIKEIISRDTFRPIVHAELLILQSLEQDGLVQSCNFFNSWKYIGSSKPTCRLCHYYFQNHSGRFQVRSTHMNLYLNWKPPDVFGRDGDAAIKAREDMMNAMVKPIREDGLRTLEERVPLGRQHDSSTGMTGPQSLSSFGSQPDMGDMKTSFAESDVTVDRETL